jgi:two-component system, OmpR family, response regulator
MPTEVLVVDDDPSVRALLAAALPARGVPVRLAAGGNEAVDVYRRHRDTIALVLLDVRMRGPSGPATLAALRALDPAVRCCIMSGEAGGSSDGQLLPLGPLRVFPKPFDSLDGLARELRQLAGSGPP